MKKIVMISGSRYITDISPALSTIDKIMQLKLSIILGDAPGVDKLVQEYLRSQNYPDVKVYFALWSGNGKPRNVTGFEIVGVSGSYVDRVDKLVQEYLRSQNYPDVKVYFALWSGNGKPRNVTGFEIVGVSGSYVDR